MLYFFFGNNERPDWSVVTNNLNHLKSKWQDMDFEMTEIETGSDEHGVAIHPSSFDFEVLQVYWNNANVFYNLD